MCMERSGLAVELSMKKFYNFSLIWHIAAETKKILKEEGKDQESIQSNTTPDPGHHVEKEQKHKKT